MTPSTETINRISNLMDHVSCLDPAPIIREIIYSYPNELRPAVTDAANDMLDLFTRSLDGYLSDTINNIPQDPEALDVPHAVHELASAATSEVLKTHPEINQQSLYNDFAIIAALVVDTHVSVLKSRLG